MKREQAKYLHVLGQHVVQLRQERGLTQEGLAERAGLTAKYVSEIERAVTNPSIVSLRALAAALDVSLPHLVAEPDEIDAEVATLVEKMPKREREKAIELLRVFARQRGD